jgi:hypothetical protein
MTPSCPAPPPFAELVDYLAGDLEPTTEACLEDHVFECAACTQRLELIAALTAGVRDLVRAARLGLVGTAALVARARSEGLRLRQYRLSPGDTVHCTAAPEDDYLVLRLAGRFPTEVDLVLDVAVEEPRTGARRRLPARPVSVDRQALPDSGDGEIVLLLPGDEVRDYPRSLWTIQVRASGTGPEEPALLGPYRMDHTPWNELGPSPAGA